MVPGLLLAILVSASTDVRLGVEGRHQRLVVEEAIDRQEPRSEPRPGEGSPPGLLGPILMIGLGGAVAVSGAGDLLYAGIAWYLRMMEISSCVLYARLMARRSATFSDV